MMSMSALKFLLLGLIAIAVLTPPGAAQADNASQQNSGGRTDYEGLPFMQAETSEDAGQPNNGGLFVRTLGAMVLIVGLIFFGAWGLKKLGFGMITTADADGSPDLTVLSSVTLGGGRTISTVRFGERLLLVGSTAQSITLLANESGLKATLLTEPRSVADLLADSERSFDDELAAAEQKFGRREQV